MAWSYRFIVISGRSSLPGVRVIRQSLLNAIISFIASSNNHIGRIKYLIHEFYRFVRIWYPLKPFLRSFNVVSYSIALSKDETPDLPPVFTGSAISGGNKGEVVFFLPPNLNDLRKRLEEARISEEDSFRDAGWGYRSKYISQFLLGLLEADPCPWPLIRSMCSTQGDRPFFSRPADRDGISLELLSAPGIGRKVRDCVLLYSYL